MGLAFWRNYHESAKAKEAESPLKALESTRTAAPKKEAVQAPAAPEEEPEKRPEEEELVRARDEEGAFVADDKSTPENEAWISKSEAEARAEARAKARASRNSVRRR